MSERSTSLAARLLVRLGWLVPLGFYLASVSRTPGWVDAPLIAGTVHHLDLSTWVNHHNLFTLLGHAWLLVVPMADPHFALNVLCSVLGAGTVYVVFRVGLLLTGQVLPSALGALVLMVSHSLWWHSTMLEVYTLSTLLMSLTLLLVVRYDQAGRFGDLCAAVFLWGLACSNHIQMGLLAFGFVGLLLFEDIRRELASMRRLFILAICFILGVQVYLWVFVAHFRELVGSGLSAERALRWMLDHTTGGQFKALMFPEGLSLRQRLFWAAYYSGLFLYNFLPPWILFAPLGLFSWWGRRGLRASCVFFGLALLVQVAWSSNYLVTDMHAFALPSYVLTSVLVILGIDLAVSRSAVWRRLVVVLSPTLIAIPLVYHVAPRWLSRNDTAVSFFEKIPQYEQVTAFWDPWDYFLNPNKRSYDAVERYSTAIMAALDPDACFWGNETTVFYPLKFYYQDVLGQRPDVHYELVFGMLLDDRQIDRHARLMLEQLDRGCSVYLTSIGQPERRVLERAYRELEPSRPHADVAMMSEKTFRESFPVYEPVAIAVDQAQQVRVFKLIARE